MAISKEKEIEINNILTNSLRHKFANYKPEPACMPFHTRLLGGDRMALFSFIHSLNTNFGTSIFEPVALSLATSNFSSALRQQSAGDKISQDAQRVIQDIMDELTAANAKPNKMVEIQRIREVCQTGIMQKINPTKIDIRLETDMGALFLIDLKTAKPNKGSFKEFKRNLLEWTACVLAHNPRAEVNTMIAIPYNPYAPKSYSRWTMAGILDVDNELKVAEEFWNLLGGKDTYQQLLDIFEKVGIKLRFEIDNYFEKYIN